MCGDFALTFGDKKKLAVSSRQPSSAGNFFTINKIIVVPLAP
jgi:hypothetical protein